MFSDWKTTLVGLLTGAGYMFLQALQSGIHPSDAAIGVGISVLGVLAKDTTGQK